MEQRAILVLYSGEEASETDVRNIMECIANKVHGKAVIHSLDSKEINQAIVSCTIIKNDNLKPNNDVENAAKFIYSTYKEDFSSGNMGRFINDSFINAKRIKNGGLVDELYRAIRILSTAECIPDKVRMKYKLTRPVMDAINCIYLFSIAK